MSELDIKGYDHKGTEVPADAVDRQELGAVDIVMNATEAAIACVITSCKGLIDAIGGMTRNPVPGMTVDLVPSALNPDHCDSTVRLMRTVALEGIGHCNPSETEVRLLASKAMLMSFHAGLMSVDISRDSSPGVTLGKLFIACCHVVLHAGHSDAEKAQALLLWRDGRPWALSGKLLEDMPRPRRR